MNGWKRNRRPLRSLAALIGVAALLLVPAAATAVDPGPGSLSPALQEALASGTGPFDVIVLFDAPAGPDDPHRRLLDSWTDGEATWYDVVPAVRARLSADDLRTLDRLDGVARVVPVEALEWTLDSSSRTLRAGEALQELDVTGRGVTVAVVDSGIDPTHPGLKDRVRANVRVHSSGEVVPISADAAGHGTHVAGIVAGSGAESPGDRYRGVAPGAGLVGVDVSYDFTTATVLHAFDWILDHRDVYDIRVVSASWGRTDRAFDPADPIVQASSRLVREGLVVVFSAGNAGPGEATLSVEAQNPDVLAVGAVDDAATIMPYSSRGPASAAAGGAAGASTTVKPDVVAPGEAITSARSTADADGLVGGLVGTVTDTADGGGSGGVDAYYTTLSGTSQASPHVAGLAALLLEARPELTPAAVSAAIQASATDLGPQGPDPAYGHGLADAKAALHLVLGLDTPSNVLVDGGTETYVFRGEVRATDGGGDGGGDASSGTAVQTYPTLEVHADGVVESAFPVKPGAAEVRAELTWTGDASFTVYLTDGHRTFGPYTDARPAADGEGRTIVAVHRADGGGAGADGGGAALPTGSWAVLAEPGGTAADAAYTTTVAVSYSPDSSSTDPDGTPRPGPNAGPAVPLLLAGGVGVAFVAVAGIVLMRRRSGQRGAADG